VSIPLPVILYSRHSGFHVFSSKHLAHGHEHHGFKMGHGTIELLNSEGEMIEKNVDGKIIESLFTVSTVMTCAVISNRLTFSMYVRFVLTKD
jgi:hypothetical protein